GTVQGGAIAPPNKRMLVCVGVVVCSALVSAAYAQIPSRPRRLALAKNSGPCPTTWSLYLTRLSLGSVPKCVERGDEKVAHPLGSSSRSAIGGQPDRICADAHRPGLIGTSTVEGWLPARADGCDLG